MKTRLVFDQCAGILFQPTLYFSSSEDKLDFSDGTVFVLLMALAKVLLASLGIGPVLGGSTAGVLTLFLAPGAAIAGTFIGAGIILFVCRGLRGHGDYGDAFAVAAALSVLLPIGQVFTSLPLLGPLLIMSWAWWIVSRGAIQVFHVAPQRANAGFAVIYAALAILSFL